MSARADSRYPHPVRIDPVVGGMSVDEPDRGSTLFHDLRDLEPGLGAVDHREHGEAAVGKGLLDAGPKGLDHRVVRGPASAHHEDDRSLVGFCRLQDVHRERRPARLHVDHVLRSGLRRSQGGEEGQEYEWKPRERWGRIAGHTHEAYSSMKLHKASALTTRDTLRTGFRAEAPRGMGGGAGVRRRSGGSATDGPRAGHRVRGLGLEFVIPCGIVYQMVGDRSPSLNRVFDALAHPARRAIIRQLSGGASEILRDRGFDRAGPARGIPRHLRQGSDRDVPYQSHGMNR
jgi:hypothetical protein